jgi:PilZ domain
LPDLQSCLRLELEKTVGKRVYFKYAGTYLTARERRQNIRVLCEDALKATLTDASGGRIEAVICDLSQAGLGLDAQQAASVQVGSRFEFQLDLSAGKIQGLCTVCWLQWGNASAEQDESGPIRFGVELDMSPALMRRLQLEVARRKKRILDELQMLGVPDLLI